MNKLRTYKSLQSDTITSPLGEGTLAVLQTDGSWEIYSLLENGLWELVMTTQSLEALKEDSCP